MGHLHEPQIIICQKKKQTNTYVKGLLISVDPSMAMES